MTEPTTEYLDEVDPSDESAVPSSGGFMKFYGLYWKKEFIFSDSEHRILAGLPVGWTGKGNVARNFDRSAMWMNFWDQKGVYVLYDRDLVPVYSGQAGLVRKSKGTGDGGRTLGERLRDHKVGKYRNGWEFFSWFGFLNAVNEKDIRKVIRQDDEKSVEIKRSPEWKFEAIKSGGADGGSRSIELNLLLDSFEAILIEAFTPKFNSRGGNLNGATYVNQLEGAPFFMKSSGVQKC